MNDLQLPINRPLVAVDNNQRDGAMRFASYGGAAVDVEPNMLAGGMPSEAPPAGTPAVDEHVEADMVRVKITLTDDDTQAGERSRSLDQMDQDHLVDNIADSIEQNSYHTSRSGGTK